MVVKRFYITDIKYYKLHINTIFTSHLSKNIINQGQKIT